MRGEQATLADRRVLVFEDEYFPAKELDRALQMVGAIVLGPLQTLNAALELIDREAAPDMAVVSLNLDSNVVGPLADTLRARGVPFLFTTSHIQIALPEGHAAVPVVDKPVEATVILRELGRLLLSDS